MKANKVERSANEYSHLCSHKENPRRSWWHRVLTDPLLHFSLLGIVLFAATFYWGDNSDRPEDNQIVVTEGKIRSLANIFYRTWQRPPTQQELDGLIQGYIKEEVLYREALAMGLDQDDTIIRRRLRQKLEFVAEDLADALEPTDLELAVYLEKHADQYRLEDRTTFTQVYFSPQRRGESLKGDVQRAFDALRSDEEVDVTEFGDPSLLPIYHENLQDTDIANLLGREFTAGIKEAATGMWTGPIESTYGTHLVKIHRCTPGRVPSLDEVRDAVRRDWFAQRRAESKKQFYDSLRERYEVVIQLPRKEQSDSNIIDEGDDAKESP